MSQSNRFSVAGRSPVETHQKRAMAGVYHNAFEGLPCYTQRDPDNERSLAQVRDGQRHVPGYTGHMRGQQEACGASYGNVSADLLRTGGGERTDNVIASIQLRNITDEAQRTGLLTTTFGTTARDERPKTKKSKIICGYGGHKPSLQRTVGATFGAYSGNVFMERSKAFHQCPVGQRCAGLEDTAPVTLTNLPTSTEVQEATAAAVAAHTATKPKVVVPDGKYYIPGTTLHVPNKASAVALGAGKASLQAFSDPHPEYKPPTKFVDWLALGPDAMIAKPSALPTYN